MATVATDFEQTATGFDSVSRKGFALLACVIVPVLGFVAVRLAAEEMAVAQVPFGPQGLPAWVAMVATLMALPMWGAAAWIVAQRGDEGLLAAKWIAALVAMVIVAPYAMAAVDPLMANFIGILVLLTGLVAVGRTSTVSGRAALLLMPGLLWAGSGALLGFSSTVAGWAPPFAPIDHNRH